MSINVTVNGNPISVTKNQRKIIATDPERSKKEFEKRRLMRLQQVRQQSKEIAEKVRNRVRQEKNKQLSKLESESKEKLKNWQARKLLELHEQYQEGLKDIGLGQKQAATELENEKTAMQKKDVEKRIADERGNKALEKQRLEDEKKTAERRSVIERRKTARTIEETRSSVASKIRQFSTSPSKVPRNKSPAPGSEKESSPQKQVRSARTLLSKSPTKVSKAQQTSAENVMALDKSAQTQIAIELPSIRSDLPLETRISERIQQRNLPAFRIQVPEEIHARSDEDQEPSTSPPIEPPIICHCHEKSTESRKENEIPVKPKITLRSAKTGGKPIGAKTRVEKINDENLIVSPDTRSEEEFYERQRQRDREAAERGKIALEKERIRKDYEELMKRLPLLQKQERVHEINRDKPKYHMNDERLKELERRRQNKIDNVYEKFCPPKQPAIITIPRKPVEKSKTPPPSLNVAASSSCESRLFTESEVKEIINHVNQKRNEKVQSGRTEQLKILAENLKMQKELLMKEINELTNDNQLVDNLLKEKKRKRLSPRVTSSSSSEIEDKSSHSQKASTRKKVKTKSKRKVLILQNTSTQTTPKPPATMSCSKEVAISPQNSLRSSPRSSAIHCKKHHIPCNCALQSSNENLCQIVIKYPDDKAPEILVKSPRKSAPSVVEERKEHSATIRVPTKKPGPEKRTTAAKKRPTPHTSTSWREQFKNTSQSTSSTSYLSPPTIVRLVETFETMTEASRESSRHNKTVDRKLATYIKKLIDMSPDSIESLSVSTASEVSTPAQSVIEMESNNPLAKLLDIMRYFNLNMDDIENLYKSQSTTGSTIESVIERKTVTTISQNKEKSTNANSRPNAPAKAAKKYEPVVKKFTELADNCNQKIATITAKIEQIRKHKRQMMSPKKDNSNTQYMDLPDKTDSESTVSSEQEELNRQLLEIKTDFARLEPRETEERTNFLGSFSDNEDDEFLSRYRRLKDMPLRNVKTTNDNLEDQTDFVPMLSISKLPKFTVQLHDESTTGTKKKPPLSKGMKKLNGNVPTTTLIAHELSTIPEDISHLSQQPKSNDSTTSEVQAVVSSTSTSSDEKVELEAMEVMLQSIGMEWAIPTLRKTRETLALTSSSTNCSSTSKSKTTSNDETSLKDFLTQCCAKISSSTTKSDTNSMSGLSEIQEYSSIHLSNNSGNVDRRRTSTPIDTRSRSPTKHVEFVKIDSATDSGEKVSFYSLTEKSRSHDIG